MSEREPYEQDHLGPEPGPEQPVHDPAPQGDGPDFAPGYGSLEASPSVYDEGYVALTPAPVFDAGGYVAPNPAPVQDTFAQPQPGYGTPPYGQQPYGAPAYGYQPNIAPYQQSQPYPYAYPIVPEHPNSGAIFGLGIASLVISVTAPFAWYLGSKARKEIARGAPYRFSGLAMTGWIIGMVYTILMALLAAFFLLVIISLN